MKALNKQVGGSHYKRYKIQPIEYSMRAELNPLEFNILKYITRYEDKNGGEDLRKALHCSEMLQEYQQHNAYTNTKFIDTIADYCNVNNLSIQQRIALNSCALRDWGNFINSVDIMIKRWHKEHNG
jgi:hypothetical protein